MYRIAVCEDELAEAQHNQAILAEIFSQHGIPSQIDTYSTAQGLLDGVARGRRYDLFLLGHLGQVAAGLVGLPLGQVALQGGEVVAQLVAGQPDA